MSSQMSDFDPGTFYDELVEHGLLVPVGVQGAFGRGARFEEVLERFDALILRTGANDGADSVTFPPVISRDVLQRVGYMDSFPNLCGAVHSFLGQERDARAISQRISEHKPWGDLLGMTDVMLNPAACYPFYPTCTGVLPENGRHVTLIGWAFRHEPSPEPTRMQAFRVREYIRVGSPEMVVEWRDMWLQRGVALLESLQLPVKADVAADPFFGRAGKMLAAGQVEQKLKFEVLIPVISRENPTACCSFNYHQDKFGKEFDIRLPNGDVAHSACLGFGMERVVMALFKTHGFDSSKWPDAVQAQLWT